MKGNLRAPAPGQNTGPATRGAGGFGFTLIDLLVVIAVICMLAAILLPAMSRAKIAADNAVCASNLRQYGVALSCYAGDFKYYPPCYLDETNAFGVINWCERLEPYTKTKWVTWDTIFDNKYPMPNSIEACPSYRRLPCAMPACYAYNNTGFSTPEYGQLGLGGTGLPPAVPSPATISPDLMSVPPDQIRLTREDDVVHPSDMIAFGDALVGDTGLNQVQGWADLCGPWWMVWFELGFPGGDFDGQAELALMWEKRRHAWHWNVVFCDGHTEKHRTRELFDGALDSVVRRWNRDNLPHPENLGRYR